MKKFLLLSLAILGFQSNAATCTVIQNGNWNDPASWSCGRALDCGDSLVIPAAMTLTVNEQFDYEACASPIKINILGTLTFQTGKKLLLPCGSEIFVQAGGQITSGGGGGNSNLIDICNVTVWTAGQGTVTGPAYLSENSVLPIQLNSFYALPGDEAIILFWESATETNNKEYAIEKSRDGLRFEVAGVIASKAPGGNSTMPIAYEFMDTKPAAGVSYYRLKQTDYNGNYTYFQIISVDHEGSKEITFTVYPNPNQGQFTVDFTGIENNHEIEVLMYDRQGKLVYNQSIFSESLATNTFSILPETQIAAGAYLVNFVVEGIKYPIKVIVQ